MKQEGWLPGYAWCSFFVMAMLNECGIPNTITGWSPTAYNKRDVIYTDGKFVQAFSDRDVLIMTLSYSSFRKQRYKGIGHTGIVDRVGKYSEALNRIGCYDFRAGHSIQRAFMQ